jgi:hypothetical protein
MDLHSRMTMYVTSTKTTLDTGINIAHGITVAPPPKNFHIIILTLFYINLGIGVSFLFFFLNIF